MARIRTIKPEFWKNEKLSALPEATHMLAAGLLNLADDEGYFNANPKLIAAELCPLREPSVSVHDSLMHLSNAGYIELGSGMDGRSYGRVVNFREHQKINRASGSKIKELLIEWNGSLSAHGGLSEPSPPEQGTGNREQGIVSSLRSEPTPAAPTPAPDDEKPKPAPTSKKKKKGAGGKKPDPAAKPRTPRQQAEAERKAERHAALADEFGDPVSGREPRARAARFYHELAKDLEEIRVPDPWIKLIPKENGKIDVEHVRSRRIRDVLKRLGGFDGWRELLERAAKSDFLTGRQRPPNSHFKVSIDFFLKPENITKLLEGFYDNRAASRRSNGERAADLETMMQEAMRRDDERTGSKVIEHDPRAGGDEPRALSKPSGGE